ncbi:hypothetical protein CAPTEDRAFT_191414 [Capitella teleta]|uniref:Uncharacterized protein n=1 Tax=Capitella teleta TaxID=283909 RepID=R7TQZ0_CAPTE|nr:hypothetical protein CAPTEDRAFT_191414 [Capitella teleta]|eukprot:ELT93455.1 hypothetical protein CAPTEDRAFT_191414 [Capitella teleta]
MALLDLQSRLPRKMTYTNDDKLEFPEIQLVPSDSNNPSTKPGLMKKEPSTPRKGKFGRVAMKVLSDIVVKRETCVIPEKNEDEVDEVEEELKVVPPLKLSQRGPSVSRRSSRHTVANLTSSRKPSIVGKGHKGMNFASLVRLAKYRKLTSGGRSSRCSSSRVSSPITEEEDTLPETPRFCATLSPEAQFAMMKGYEDELLRHLKSQVKSKDMLFRVKTPLNRVSAIQLANLGRDPPETTKSEGHPIRRPSNKTANKIDLNMPMRSRTYDSQSCLLKSKSKLSPRPHTVSETISTIPKEKQLQLSVRFQKAMDILDNLKQSQGLPVISTKNKKTIDNPLATYNTWSQGWCREFQFQYNTAST